MDAMLAEFNILTGSNETSITDDLVNSPFVHSWLSRHQLQLSINGTDAVFSTPNGQLVCRNSGSTAGATVAYGLVAAAHQLWKDNHTPEDPLAFAGLVYDGILKENVDFTTYIDLIQRFLVREYYLAIALKSLADRWKA